MISKAFDCETHIIQPGQLFPRLVCVSTYDGLTENLYLAKQGVDEILAWLQDPNIRIIGHNITFDLGVIVAEAIDLGHDAQWVLSLVFTAYAADRIVDTMIRSMLIDIASGNFQEIDGQRRGRHYGLDVLSDRWLQTRITQKSFTKAQYAAGMQSNSWRLHYAYLQNTPIKDWPVDASKYAIEDAVVTWKINAKIDQYALDQGSPVPSIPDEYRQHRAAWVLHLIAGWGVRVDEDMVKLVRENLETQRKVSYEIMDQYGIFKKDKAGNFKLTKKGARQKNIKLLRELIADGYKQQGEPCPMTEGGKKKDNPQVATDADSARDSGNPAAIEYANGASAEKLLSTYVPILERGKGNRAITSSPNVLVASGRTSWTNPNWQNPPKVGGIRECVIARPGTVFVGADLDTVELRALAQCCLETIGWSEMAAALQRGEDLHLGLAAEIVGVDYATAQTMYKAGDPIIEAGRHTGKQVNFGLPGGMGNAKFAITAINNDSPLITDPSAPLSAHIRRAGQLKEIWFKKWPEMRIYLQNASNNTGDFGSGTVEQPWSGRIRGGLGYCNYANTLFQGRVADGAKLALWRVAYACYVDKSSVLYGSRIVLFLHDEIILESPEGLADPCAKELVKIMCGAVQEVIPDVPITSTGVITRRWFKSAKPVYVNGILVPCKPEKDKSGKTKWVHDIL